MCNERACALCLHQYGNVSGVLYLLFVPAIDNNQ